MTARKTVTLTNAKEGEVEQFCEDLQDFEDVLFVIRDWNEK